MLNDFALPFAGSVDLCRTIAFNDLCPDGFRDQTNSADERIPYVTLASEPLSVYLH